MWTLRCVHKWAVLYGTKLIWFVAFASYARGLQSSGMISGKVWPLPTNLCLFFENCITFNGCFCLVRSKKDTASASPSLKVSKLTQIESLRCILDILLSAQLEKRLKLVWVCLSKSTAADFICSKHIFWITPCGGLYHHCPSAITSIGSQRKCLCFCSSQ